MFQLDSNAGYEGDDEGKRDKLVKGKTKQSNTRQKVTHAYYMYN